MKNLKPLAFTEVESGEPTAVVCQHGKILALLVIALGARRVGINAYVVASLLDPAGNPQQEYGYSVYFLLGTPQAPRHMFPLEEAEAAFGSQPTPVCDCDFEHVHPLPAG